MITPLPSIQHSCKLAYRYIMKRRRHARWIKAFGNRRYRRHLERVTRAFIRDPELFYGEVFDAPSLSGWDID